MFDEARHDSIVQQGIDEALACRDMLEPSPVQPSLLARSLAWCLTSARDFAFQRWPRKRRATPTSPTGSGIHRSLCWGDILAARALSEVLPPDGRRPVDER